MLGARLKDLVRVGRLTVVYPDGEVGEYGEAGAAPAVIVRLSGRATASHLDGSPEQALGEVYAQGDLTVEEGGLAGFLDLLFHNRALAASDHPPAAAGWFEQVSERLAEPKDYGGAKGEAVMRYFGKQAAYEAFLGERRMQLSAGYAPPGRGAAADLQEAGRRHIAEKLRISPGQHVLDLGAGWGVFPIWLAKNFDVRVTGYTLGDDQLIQARRDVEAAGLADRVRIEKGDFRKAEERFDRVLAIGSFEHVGAGNYADYFLRLRERLAPDGVALVHTTGRPGPPRPLNRWVAKHFFPGSHVPSLSEMTTALETSGLWLTDVEILRRHGEKTIAAWRRTLGEDGGTLMDEYDEVDRRRWSFLLAAAEAAFRYGELETFELQLTRGLDTLPITRDYMLRPAG